MSLYRFEAKIHGRSGREGGRSIISASAYRSGTKLNDERYEVQHDYSRRQQGIAHTEIMAPAGAPVWATDRERLWNAVEKGERRKDSQLAREFILALPANELTPNQRLALVRRFVQKEMVDKGMVADVSIHEPKEGLNHHAHVLATMRPIGKDGFGQKERSWNSPEQLIAWRKGWEEHCNQALKDSGSGERVDCRSLADRGIDRQPQPKLGPAAAAMERRGIESRRGVIALTHAFADRIVSALRAIEGSGEVKHSGLPGAWWLERGREAIGDAVDTVREVGREAATAGRDFWRDQSSLGMYLPEHQPTRPARERVERERDEPGMSR